MIDELDTRRRRAVYRAQHRGTKEMDWMLGRYAVAEVASMTTADLQLFEELLTVADPEIHAWLMHPATYPQGAFQDLLSRIRTFHDL